MRAVCTICADTLKDDFSAAPCGHAFHSSCLDQWLAHQKNCPQCRMKCTKKQTIKLFLESGGLDSTLVLSDNDISNDDLKERMKEQYEMFKEKDKTLKETLKELTQVREELLAWRSQHDSVAFKLQQERGLAESLKDQMKILQKDRESLERKAEESMDLRREITKYTKIQHLLSSYKTDSDTQSMIETASPNMLKNYVKALKIEYEMLKDKRSSLQEERKRHTQQISQYKKKLNDTENELHNLREKISLMESDLHAAESDKDSLTTKIQILEKAIESPNSRIALRRLLESPLPDKLDFKRPKLDLSLNGSFISNDNIIKTQEKKPIVPPKAIKSVNEEIAVPLLVTNLDLNTSTACLRTGFNGLGGHTNYIKPKVKPVSSGALRNRQPFKFNPRVSSTSKTSFMKQSTFSSMKFK